MTAYYNENDPFAAAWLRELIARNLIAPGDVDERSIEDVEAKDLDGYTQCHFFAGIGGWSYALRLAGWPDYEPVWTGSCPCQPFSVAGRKGGEEDSRHLWPAFFRLIRQRRPVTVFGEQVASKDGLAWFDTVATDLESEAYRVGAVDLCAASVGAFHVRQRLYWVADSNLERLERVHKTQRGEYLQQTSKDLWRYWSSEPEMDRVADGLPGRVGRLRGYGNAIVPQVAQAFIEAYLDCSEHRCEEKQDG